MRVSARVDYALRASAELASAPPGPVHAEQIARAQGIPRRFLDNILLQLRKSGILRSRRGRDGGYQLARPAAQITLADIVRAVEGPPLRPPHTGRRQGVYPGAARPLAHLWDALREAEEATLESITLADVASDQLWM
ncbi:RrF2 family transcriptional regulator [Rhizohabitans arisaemae]|uniref:RrF2 family transcriptional regulator n=1 Tax=Rhizohabitans arisaemae TaxID=2720610 RepID=UPI0024B25834|nr:Rrf2 family transcriptional regulator [Rhizohabitans arisaemae]